MSVLLDPRILKLVSDINTPYTSCYCEENIYLACQALVALASPNLQDVYAVFISNATKTASNPHQYGRLVLLWGQRASSSGVKLGQPVVWDYHVILVLVAATDDGEITQPSLADRTYVVDFDSALGTLTSWKDYTLHTFQPHLFTEDIFDLKLQSMFRVISAPHFIDQFASDRSHMLEATPEGALEYAMPPPAYEPILGQGARANGTTNNLMNEFVCMTTEGAPNSEVLQMGDFLGLRWLHRA